MGTLFLVSTPIGNLEDLSFRACKTLLTADIVACEDTRRTGLLISEIKKRYAQMFPELEFNAAQTLKRYDNRSEVSAAADLLPYLVAGKSVALATDAGTPLISDPGFLLVRECRRRAITVISIPGPSAAIAALVSSGLSVNQFLFLGFLPEKSGHRIKLLQEISGKCSGSGFVKPTLVAYCPPHKLETTLQDLQTVYGDITLTIARELTKVHEETVTTTISAHLARTESYVGEIVLLWQLS